MVEPTKDDLGLLYRVAPVVSGVGYLVVALMLYKHAERPHHGAAPISRLHDLEIEVAALKVKLEAHKEHHENK